MVMGLSGRSAPTKLKGGHSLEGDQAQLGGQHISIRRVARGTTGHVRVQTADLVSGNTGVQKLVGEPLGGQEDAIPGQDAQAGARLRSGLHGVFHLVETALRRKDRGSGIVETCHLILIYKI